MRTETIDAIKRMAETPMAKQLNDYSEEIRKALEDFAKENNIINILGTDYTIKRQTKSENPKLENAWGICEWYSKEIVVDTFEEAKKDTMCVDTFEEFEKKVMRHEIIHAFLGESGLKSNSDWAENEEMIDWFAIQAPKIYKAFKELEII